MSTDTAMTDAQAVPTTQAQPQLTNLAGRTEITHQQSAATTAAATHSHIHPSQHARKTSITNDIPPLTHPSRTQPIHPPLPNPPLLPTASAQPTNGTNTNTAPPHTSTLHPITLLPFTTQDYTTHNFGDILSSVSNNGATIDKQKVHKLQQETVSEIEKRMRERERKEKEVEREVAEMEKTREIERKVWLRKMGGAQGQGQGRVGADGPVGGGGAAAGQGVGGKDEDGGRSVNVGDAGKG